MKYLLSFALFFSISGMSYANTQIIKDLTTILNQGIYTGITDDGEKCQVNVSTSKDMYNVSVTPKSFNFQNEDGSTECMYSKACFRISNRSKLIDLKDTESEYYVKAERPGGGPDLASSKKMTINLSKNSKGLRVSVKEKIGLFNLQSTEANCILK